MKKRLYVLGLASLIALTYASTSALANSSGGEQVHYPSPEEIAAEQPTVYNPESDQFEVPQALGDAMADLVYTPVTPCRMVDTRFGSGSFTGPIAAGTTLNIDTIGTGYSFQGGNSTGCDTIDNPAALAVSITAVSPAANGYITAWAWGATQPTVSVLNYRTGVNINNTTIVPQDTTTAGYEMSLYTFSTTHIVVDVVGYFNPPVAAAPSQYVTSSGLVSIGIGPSSTYSPACPTGYRVSGGGGGLDNWTADVPMTSSRPANGELPFLVSGANAADRWVCQFDNNTAGNVDVYCFALCLRIP